MENKKNSPRRRQAAAFIAAILCLALSLCACGEGAKPPADTSADASGTVNSGAVPSGDVPSGGLPSGDAQDSSDLPSEVPEEIPPLPESGELSLLPWGSGYLPAGFDGVNPRISEDGRLALLFAGATDECGLDLAEGLELAYTLKDASGSVTEEGTAALDTAEIDGLQGKGGYKGLAFSVKKAWKRGETGYLTLTFKDQKGIEYKVENAEIYKGLQYLGVTPTLFDLSDIGVKTAIKKETVVLTGRFSSTEFELTLRLNFWAQKTKPEQIAQCARLFFDCYPKMYARFGERFGSSKSVTLAVENGGYEIASAGGSEVHIHDEWLKNHRTDYDCLTHEFGHVIQNGWDGNYCQYSGFIERFADYCRYVYAYREGYYNDSVWELNTVDGEDSLENSVRFLVWLDQFHSTKEIDLIARYFDVIFHKKYPAARWKEAWKEIFEGTDLAGMTGEEAFALYAKDGFARVSAKAGSRGGRSPLLKEYGTREQLLARKFD